MKHWLKPLFLTLCILGLVAMQACSKAPSDGVEAGDPATFEIQDILKRTTDKDVPMLKITYKNNGGVTAFDLSCSVNVLKDGEKLKTVAADITTDLNPATLPAGQTALMTAELTGVANHAAYTDLTFDFSWREARSQVGSGQSVLVPAAAIQSE